MRTFSSPLPIDAALPGLVSALGTSNAAVLVAPPGAGKTTRVPLVLIDEAWATDKKVLVLEPRRLAARAAASRMAATLGEQVGDTVGLRVRFGSKVSKRTRIEVVTEGIFTRLVLDDPSLDGIAAVLFDEFHERSLDADLGLALARDAQQGLREDLRLLVMSATLDGARVASLLGNAPVVESEGRAFPVETRYLGRDPRARIENQVADAVERALRAEPGSLLVFLPGAGEIRRAETLLKERVRDPSVDVVALFGALDMRDQDRAIAPAPAGRRKVVLATSIAETSLTIEGVRVVIDSGLSRVPRYEPDVGITRLETVRVSRAAADQRRGRAGRTEPGVCYRLWDEPQTGSLEAYTRPVILSADLSSFVLDLAQWGATDPSTLAFLDQPPSAALSEAKTLLTELNAIDAQGRITEEGRKLRQLPLPPRLARMVVDAAAEGAGDMAATVAAIVTERGLGGDDVNLEHRLDQFRRDRSKRAEDARAMVKRWADTAGGRGAGEISAGEILALGYPDRIAKSRGGGTGAFLLANGRGGNVDPASSLAREAFLAVAELTGAAVQSRILLAAPITLPEIEARFGGKIEDRDAVTFDNGSASLRARRTRRLGALVLAEQIKQVSPDADTARTLAQGIVSLGLDKLPWSKAALQFRKRVGFLRKAEGDEWPDLSNEGLALNTADWLEPILIDKTSRSQIGADELSDAVMGPVPWNLRRRLDEEAPTHFTAPTGTAVPIDYEAEQGPTISIRVQELFGLSKHPSIADGRVPLVIELLSPGHKPVQITRDLPGFWHGSYADVRVEMRGRYPRHPWPADPANAPPTRRAKPRGQ
ncbi:ATP-dependent helicase HrpB [Pseudolabrys taiwanensis]|uniref:ATP-dependent helicase HrpB n=1 Tax=Pseudolabrys taiwanensis TaxID=331696 RepID=A0A345ZY96_9HYPH|nr:ATP-dependent helicase HrpB [Pseudolabrys taiwanensis]AXK81893.1 ATP-dependent helicase HrpB [Pseudolabrys taiwanensis]